MINYNTFVEIKPKQNKEDEKFIDINRDTKYDMKFEPQNLSTPRPFTSIRANNNSRASNFKHMKNIVRDIRSKTYQ